MMPLALLAIVLGAAAVLSVPLHVNQFGFTQTVQAQADVLAARLIRDASIQFMRDNPGYAGEIPISSLSPYFPNGLNLGRNIWAIAGLEGHVL